MAEGGVAVSLVNIPDPRSTLERPVKIQQFEGRQQPCHYHHIVEEYYGDVVVLELPVSVCATTVMMLTACISHPARIVEDVH